MTGAAVQISHLSKRYSDFVAVDDVSLDVAPGEFVTLLGLSGSGKTTTLMAVAGFVELDAGRIAIDGRDIANLPPEKRDLGVVFQNYALFPHLNVFENVAFPLRMRKWARPAIEKAIGRVLEIVSLGHLATRRIAELSGGQQQRVALARALVFEPPVLLMDEPLGALDRSLRDQLQTEIKRIQRDLGVTVLYVTHDQEEALALSDRIAVMAEGKICQLATPDEIYENPASAFVAGFVGESNFIDVTMRGQNGPLATVALAGIPGALFTATTSPATQPAQAQAVMAIRPEALRLSALQDTAPCNVLPGRIALREFMGATVRLTIDTELGPLIVRDGRVSEAARFKAGDTVRLSWSERDALLFPPR